MGTSNDCNDNGVPDEFDISDCDNDPACGDCDGKDTPDQCDIAACAGGPACEDCNVNGIPDACDINAGADDVNGNGIPDECEVRTPLPADSPNARLKNRYISFKPDNPGRSVKLKVTLTAGMPHPASVGDS